MIVSTDRAGVPLSLIPDTSVFVAFRYLSWNLVLDERSTLKCYTAALPRSSNKLGKARGRRTIKRIVSELVKSSVVLA